MKFFYLPILLTLCLATTAFSQERGRVFPRTPKTPMEQVNRNGKIVVRNTMYGLVFQDNEIPQAYKKAVQMFFKKRLNGYADIKTYTLKIENYQGYIWVEGYKITKAP